jgi:hypothetical protein
MQLFGTALSYGILMELASALTCTTHYYVYVVGSLAPNCGRVCRFANELVRNTLSNR